MAKENIPTDFELYKLITLLKNNDYIIPDVSFTKLITHSLLIIINLLHIILYCSKVYFFLHIYKGYIHV